MNQSAHDPETPPPSMGAPTPGHPADVFFESFLRLTPHTPITWTILAINLAAFVASLVYGVDWLHPSTDQLRRLGGNYAPWTTDGQLWRLAASMIIHGGVIHLVLTGVSLWSVGRFAERLVGHAGLAVAYIASGIAGAMSSAAWNPHVTSVGSSGAIFGLLGLILACFVRQRASIAPEVLRPLRRNTTLVVVANLALGFSLPTTVDNAAHVGGLAAGCLLGLILAQPLTVEGVRRRTRGALVTAAASLVLLSFAAAALPRYPDMPRELESTRVVEVAAHQAAAAAIQARLFGQIDDRALVLRLEGEALRPLQAERDHLLGLVHVPPFYRGHLEAAVRSLETRIQGYTMLCEATMGPR